MIEAVVLAAGKGKRMGRSKPLVAVDGVSSLTRVIRTLKQAGIERIIVVLGHEASKIRRAVDLDGCEVVVNADYKTGMASSLKTGIEALSETAEGFLILHADMPYLSSSTVRAVLDRARDGAKIVAPTYQESRGFPVYLHRSCLPELLPPLTGDIGARRYLDAHKQDLVLIPVDDPGAVWDIDCPKDLKRERGMR
jgi:CTP:molybdopterin cytidylyltransferase MocA